MSKTTFPTASLALNLLRQETAARPNKNVVLSPTSIFAALGLVMNGASTNTLVQMAISLGLPINTSAANGLCPAPLETLNRAGTGVKLMNVNAIFLNRGYQYQSDFITMKEKYFGDVGTLDFNPASAASQINDWVSFCTLRHPDDKEGMITNLVKDPIDPHATMLLLNALVFKGEWSLKFDKSLTKRACFTTGDGSKVQRDLMYRRFSNLPHQAQHSSNVYQAVRLPFGANQECHQLVIAPVAGRSVQDVLAVLTPEKLVQLCGLDLSSPLGGQLWLPRQQLTYDRTLNDTLIQLGMWDLFDAWSCDLADLYDRADGNVSINTVRHKTVFSLDEDGGEGTILPKPNTNLENGASSFAMRVDRDFLEFTVTREGDIIFANYVSDPCPQA